MKTNTFKHLQSLCENKRVVCERIGRTIELVTPDGGTTAVCHSVAEAIDTMRNDSSFSDLPISLKRAEGTVCPACGTSQIPHDSDSFQCGSYVLNRPHLGSALQRGPHCLTRQRDALLAALRDVVNFIKLPERDARHERARKLARYNAELITKI